MTNIGFCPKCDALFTAYVTLVRFDRRAALGALRAYDAHRDSTPHGATT